MEKGMFQKLGENIKTLRKQKNMSQKKLGIAMGKSEESAQPYVAKLEKGKKPNTDDLICLSEIFKVSIDSLLGRNNIRNKESNITTLQDVLLLIFELENIGISIDQITSKDTDFNPYTETFYETERITNCISFQYAYLNDFLINWKRAKEISTLDGDIYKQMYKTWKEDELKKAKEYIIDVDGGITYSPEMDEMPF